MIRDWIVLGNQLAQLFAPSGQRFTLFLQIRVSVIGLLQPPNLMADHPLGDVRRHLQLPELAANRAAQIVRRKRLAKINNTEISPQRSAERLLG